MTQQRPCVICDNEAACYRGDGAWFHAYECPRCGCFDYDASLGWRKVTSADEMVRLSGWVREQNLAGIEFARISPAVRARVSQISLPGLRERSLRLLAALAARSPGLSYLAFTFTQARRDLELQALTYSRNEAELGTLLDILRDDQFIKSETGDYFGISVKGLLKAEELGSAKSSLLQGFVAMNFDETLNDAWSNGFASAIRAAGFHPFRIDNKDYVGGITDEIMAEIRRSRFVVADYTGQKSGVYFEAGFALGLGLTVIPTCHADEIGKLHFDIRHLNTLPWKTPEELADGLAKRIRAVVGAGPNASA